MKPSTTKSEFPDHCWQLILITAVGMTFEGSVSMEWLIRETTSKVEEDES